MLLLQMPRTQSTTAQQPVLIPKPHLPTPAPPCDMEGPHVSPGPLLWCSGQLLRRTTHTKPTSDFNQTLRPTETAVPPEHLDFKNSATHSLCSYCTWPAASSLGGVHVILLLFNPVNLRKVSVWQQQTMGFVKLSTFLPPP